jgi:2,3-bisphosphoglycerate-independent phosphoglycerate mutase
MVGHTGKLAETVSAVETLDGSFGRVERAAREAGAALLMTADHGNAEKMIDEETGQPHTAHTTNPVPFVMVGGGERRRRLAPGSLADVAPTILALQGLPAPPQMTGRPMTGNAD